MIIKATDEQMIKAVKLAILASKPMGMGFLHFDAKLKEEDINDIEIRYESLYVDYYQGRMVKFSARRKGDNNWEVNEVISYEYQSWKSKYDNYSILLEEVKKNESRN